ncbi:hypothetical protein F2P45_27920 [Massilia sp. CCM 8733]|uniref:Uncharacterized protein n=1 Tax=Massilia mucilaginosa TaxID=2609282 RepID=A0ABX0P1J3_9BURK|nr:hypothetical protein [Massilia mucilaginosa]NHZ92806.1 hypothetical protein [Massilia mucilaginosa]
MPKFNNDARVIALHRITVASPCTASWDAMQGDARVRHCGDCDKKVFNLSAMPEAEAAMLVAEHSAGGMCVRFYRRADGSVMTSDCGAPSAGARPPWRALPGQATAAVLAMSLAACAQRPPAPEDMLVGVLFLGDMPVSQGDTRPETPPPAVMGEMPSPPVPRAEAEAAPDARGARE